MKHAYRIFGRHLSARSDIYFAAFLVMIVAMIVIPLPTVVVDVLLAVNMMIALLIFVTTIYLKNVLDLSTFPTLLLVSTMFRLALTISTTRLILADGDAGQIITSFGEFVVAGNVAVGIIVFLIIAVVQFIVVTKGAERIAEVSARFTLDALPGKQMSIDADLRAGTITGAEAQEARKRLQTESQFFGAMDGALRFVKGDAIASLIVIFVNLVGGIAIATLQRGLPLSEAGSLYALLTVGDGLVAQIPALLSAAAAGTVVTRVAVGRDSKLASEIGMQVFGSVRVLSITAVVLVCMALLPGFPTAIFLALAGLLAAVAFGIQSGLLMPPAEVGGAETDVTAGELQTIIRARYSDTVMVKATEETIDSLEARGLAPRLDAVTMEGAREIGATNFLPGFRADESLPPGTGTYVLEGVPIGRLDLSETRDIDEIATEIGWYARRSMGYVYGINELAQIYEEVGKVHGRLGSEVEQTVPPLVATEVVRLLIRDFVPLGSMRSAFEMLLKDIYFDKDPYSLAGKARALNLEQLLIRLSQADGSLAVIALDSTILAEVEETLDSVSVYDDATVVAAATRIARDTDLVDIARSLNRRTPPPALLVAERLRVQAARVVAHLKLFIPVLAETDIPDERSVMFVGVVASRQRAFLAEAAE